MGHTFAPLLSLQGGVSILPPKNYLLNPDSPPGLASQSPQGEKTPQCDHCSHGYRKGSSWAYPGRKGECSPLNSCSASFQLWDFSVALFLHL